MPTASPPDQVSCVIPSQRALFDLPDDVAYLNCAYMAPQLRAVTAAGRAAVVAKAQPWTIAPADFFTGPQQVREAFAALIGGDADGVAIVPSVSYAMATAAVNLPVGPGDRIVVLAEQFPANVYPWRALAARRGAGITTVVRPADDDWTGAVGATIDGRTAVVAVPHCHWTDGGLLDLGEVRAACDAVGAALVIDATQSLGAIPLTVDGGTGSARPDVLVSAGYKWLLGPYSLGFAWYAPHLRDGVPIEESWSARAGSEHFAGLVDYADGYQPGARRYDVGEVANFVLLPMALAALTQISDWGIDRIALTLRQRTDAIVGRAAELGLTAAPRDLRAPHLLGLRLPPGIDPGVVAAALAARGVHVSVRGRSVRVSPHLWTTQTDLDRLHDALATAIRA
jgi:selenocysteine lyase/cysteine desulfurase